jgi:hypothetical protein
VTHKHKSHNQGGQSGGERGQGLPHGSGAGSGETPRSGESRDMSDSKGNPSRSHSLDWWTMAINAVIAISAFASFWVFFFQLRDAHKMAALDQRPWIKLSVAWQTDIAPNRALGVLIHTENVGKTAAKVVNETFILEKLESGQAPSFNYNKAGTLTNLLGMIMPDVLVPDTNFPLFAMGNNPPPPVLGDVAYKELVSGRAYLALFGKAEYLDIYGTQHWTHFCIWKNYGPGNFNAVSCNEYNNVDAH